MIDPNNTVRPELVEDPKTITITPEAAALGWAVQRMAALQGRSADRLHLHQALTTLDTAEAWSDQVAWLAQHLGWECAPQALPDEARLPHLVHSSEHGWCVIVSRDATGLWVAETPQGKQQLATDDWHGKLSCSLRLTLPKLLVPKRALNVVKSAFGQYKGVVLEGVMATLLINVLALATSFFSMQVYDRVIPSQGYATLWLLTGGVMLSILFELALKYTRSRVMDHAVVGMDNTLSRDVFQRLLNVRLDQLPQSVGSLAGQLRGFEGVRALLTASTAYLIVDVPFALFFIFVLGLLGTPYMTLVPLVFLLASLIAGFSIKRRINALAKEGARAGNEKTGLLVEAVEGAETIKAGYGGWRFLSRWLDVNGQAIGYDVKIRHLSEISGYFTASFQQISYAGLVAVGAWQVIEGNMTMGALIACSILSGRALAPVGMLPGLMVQYAHAKAAMDGLERIYALESDGSGIDKPLLPDGIQGNYQLQNVRYAYTGAATPALNVANLSIRAGEKVAVLGAVGSGKSTLLRLLSGMYQPREGRILLDGLELSHLSRQRLTEHVGFLQQEHRLFLGTLRDNLLIGLPDPGDESLLGAAKQTGLMQLISAHPKGLDMAISEGGKGLSGGQKQLVALTRLVLTKPNIWLLDEPTAHMDDELERKCLNVLQTMMTPLHTLVVVTHKSSLLPLVNRLIVVAGQRVVLDGPRDDVLAKLSGKGLQANTSPNT